MKTFQRGIRRMAAHERTHLYARWDMRERGWTDGLLAKYLATPDDYRDNSHYRRAGAPQKYWLKERVHAAEATPEISVALEKVLSRRATLGRNRAIKCNPTPEEFMTEERAARFAAARAELAAFRATA